VPYIAESVGISGMPLRASTLPMAATPPNWLGRIGETIIGVRALPVRVLSLNSRIDAVVAPLLGRIVISAANFSPPDLLNG
jgi:hypothetical protein